MRRSSLVLVFPGTDICQQDAMRELALTRRANALDATIEQGNNAGTLNARKLGL